MEILWDDYFGKLIMTFLISMVPVIELRGAIPIAVAHGIHPLIAMIIAMVGNLFPVPFIIVFIRRVFEWIRKKSNWLNNIVTKLELRAEKKKKTVEKYKMLGLFIFVAIPLPGTGAWTGALIAAMMNMRIKQAFPSIALGVLTAGIIVLLVTVGVGALVN